MISAIGITTNLLLNSFMLIVNCLVVAAIELVPRFYVGSTLLVLFAFAIALIMLIIC